MIKRKAVRRKPVMGDYFEYYPEEEIRVENINGLKRWVVDWVKYILDREGLIDKENEVVIPAGADDYSVETDYDEDGFEIEKVYYEAVFDVYENLYGERLFSGNVVVEGGIIERVGRKMDIFVPNIIVKITDIGD